MVEIPGTAPGLIPDPLCFGAVRSYQMQWIWDQSDQGNRISSDGRNTWNRAGLIPGPIRKNLGCRAWDQGTLE